MIGTIKMFLFIVLFIIAAFVIWFAMGGKIKTCPSGYTLVTHPINLNEPKTCQDLEQMENVCPSKQTFREGLVMGLFFGIPAVFLFMGLTFGWEDMFFLIKVTIVCLIIAAGIVLIQEIYFADHPIVIAQEKILTQFINILVSCD